MLDSLLTTRTFTREQYHQLVERGELREDDRVELIDGEIVEMSPIGRPHAIIVNRLARHFILNSQDQFICSVQNPIALGNDSEPQPDLCLLRLSSEGDVSQHPGPAEVLLLVEVMNTSRERDTLRKLPVYAEAGIPEVWLIDLTAFTITVCTQPQGNHYQQQELRQADPLQPQFCPSLQWTVAEIFAPLQAGGTA